MAQRTNKKFNGKGEEIIFNSNDVLYTGLQSLNKIQPILDCEQLGLNILNSYRFFFKKIFSQDFRNLYFAGDEKQLFTKTKYESQGDFINGYGDVVEIKTTRSKKKYDANQYTCHFESQYDLPKIFFFVDDKDMDNGKIIIDFKVIKQKGKHKKVECQILPFLEDNLLIPKI